MLLLGYNEYKSRDYTNIDSGKQDRGYFSENTEGLVLLSWTQTQMAAAAKQLNYPQKLTDHLKQFSVEKEDECKMYREWLFSHTEDSGEADRECPCGKKGIRYLCYITNETTRKQTFVGTTCVEFFDEDMKEVLKLTLGLISTGTTGKYKGSGNRENKDSKYAETQFLSPSSRDWKPFLITFPFTKKVTEIQVFTSDYGLMEDQRYKMRIKTSRWDQHYGTGISFTVIERQETDWEYLRHDEDFNVINNTLDCATGRNHDCTEQCVMNQYEHKIHCF